MKKIFLGILFWVSSYSFLTAQVGLYRVRLAALQKDVSLETFKKMEDLGVLFTEPLENGFTRIYLGTYLGRNTATRVMNTAKQRGYKTSYTAEEMPETPKNNDYTVQIGSFKKLDVRKFNALDTEYRNKLYISYHKGFYRVSLGIFDKNNNPELGAFYLELARRLGADSAYIHQFNKVHINQKP